MVRRASGRDKFSVWWTIYNRVAVALLPARLIYMKSKSAITRSVISLCLRSRLYDHDDITRQI